MRNFTRTGELKVSTGATGGSSSGPSTEMGEVLGAGTITPLALDVDGIAVSQAISVTADDDGIAEVQALTEDTPLVLESAAASLVPPRFLTFRSIADFSAINFEIVGVDSEGDPVSELINGAVGAAQDDDGIALAQAPAVSTALALESAAATLFPARSITFTSASDLSLVNFEIVGTDENGDPQTVAVFAGPNNETKSTSELWSEVTSITPDATNANTLTVGWADVEGTINSSNAYREVTSITPDTSDAGTIEVGWLDSSTTFGLILTLSEFDSPRHITLTSTDDLSSVDFRLIGVDANGEPVIEILGGPNNATVTSVARFGSLTAIIPQTLGTGSVSAGWPDEAYILFKAQSATEISHLYVRNNEVSEQSADFTLVVDGEEIPWVTVTLEADAFESVFAGDSPVPLNAGNEIRVTATSGAFSYTLHGRQE